MWGRGVVLGWGGIGSVHSLWEGEMAFWQYLGRSTDIISIFTLVASSYAAYRLWRQKKDSGKHFYRAQNFQELRESFAGVQTDNPVAFALSLTPSGHSIKKSVETFLKTQKLKMDIEEVKMNGINNEEDIERSINLVKEKRHFFEETGVSEIHLFIAGPVQAGTIIGALYDNWIPIKLYHKPTPPPPQVYEYWMPLTKN